MQNPVVETLRRAQLFATLSPGDLSRIGRIVSLRRVAKRETVFRDGDPADGFFLIAPGWRCTGRWRTPTTCR